MELGSSQRAKQQFDRSANEAMLIEGRGLDFSPLITPEEITDRLSGTILPSKYKDYAEGMVDNRVGLVPTKSNQRKLASLLMEPGSVELSRVLVNQLLNTGRKFDPDSVNTFRTSLRKQGVIFQRAVAIKTTTNDFEGSNHNLGSLDIYEQSLMMARQICGIKAPQPHAGCVAFVGRIVSVSNLELTNQVGSTTYSMTPQIVCRHWVDKDTLRRNKRVVKLYQSKLTHKPKHIAKFNLVASDSAYEAKALCTALGFDIRALSRDSSAGDESLNLDLIHNAMRTCRLPADYNLRIIKACVLYLAASSSVRGCITANVPPMKKVQYITYDLKELTGMFNSGKYNPNNMIVYADAPDQDYCLFLQLLLMEVSGDLIQDGNAHLYMGGYALPAEEFKELIFISRTKRTGSSQFQGIRLTPARIASWLNRYCRSVCITQYIPQCMIVASVLMAGELMPNIRLPTCHPRHDLFAARLETQGQLSDLLATKPSEYIWMAGIVLATQTKLMIKDVIAEEMTSTGQVNNMLSNLQGSVSERMLKYEYYASHVYHSAFIINRLLDPLFIDNDIVEVVNRHQVNTLLWSRMRYGEVRPNTWLHLAQNGKIGPYDGRGHGTKTETATIAATLCLVGAGNPEKADGRSIPQSKVGIRLNQTYQTVMMQQSNGSVRIIDDGIDHVHIEEDDIDIDSWPEVTDFLRDYDTDTTDSDDSSDNESEPDDDDGIDEQVVYGRSRSSSIRSYTSYDSKKNNSISNIKDTREVVEEDETISTTDTSPKSTILEEVKEEAVEIPPPNWVDEVEFFEKNAAKSPVERETDNMLGKFAPKPSSTGSYNVGCNWLGLNKYIKETWNHDGPAIHDVAYAMLSTGSGALPVEHKVQWVSLVCRLLQQDRLDAIVLNQIVPNAPECIREYVRNMYTTYAALTPCWMPLRIGIDSFTYFKHIKALIDYVGVMSPSGDISDEYDDLPVYTRDADGFKTLVEHIRMRLSTPSNHTYIEHAYRQFIRAMQPTISVDDLNIISALVHFGDKLTIEQYYAALDRKAELFVDIERKPSNKKKKN